MIEFDWPILPTILVFIVCGGVIAYAGTLLSRYADQLADRTGLGEAIMGAVFLGATTSLPGIITSIVTAANGFAEMAISNAIGGMAAQTLFLVVADMFYRKANLEHAAPSVPNLMNGAILIGLLGMILLAMEGPEVSFMGIHPVTPLLFLAYAYGVKLARASFKDPQWKPLQTDQTEEDVEGEVDQGEDVDDSTTKLWVKFALAGLVTALCGYFVAQSGMNLVQKTGLNETIIGGIFTAVATSTPELVTAVAAVRRGALTLAVGDIIGGNAFDVLFAGAADIAWNEGSIYHAVGAREQFLIGMTVVMTAVLLLGMLHREKKGLANIGFESALILILYVGGFVVLATAM